jgi:hypothetical protein
MMSMSVIKMRDIMGRVLGDRFKKKMKFDWRFDYKRVIKDVDLEKDNGIIIK